MPSSNTARLTARSKPLAVTITSVGLDSAAWAEWKQVAAGFDLRGVGLADGGRQRLKGFVGQFVAIAFGQRPLDRVRELGRIRR